MTALDTTTPRPPRARQQCPTCVLRHRGLCEGVDSRDVDGSAALDAAHGSTRVYAAGDLIYAQGDRAVPVFNLISGWVALHRDYPDGRRQIIEFLQPAAIFGLEAAGEALGHGATALTNISLCPIGSTQFAELRRRVPSFNERFVSLLLRGIHHLREVQVSLGQGSAKERIAALLSELARIALGSGAIAAGARIRIPLSQRLVAEATGLTSVHVNRVLRQLREGGVVELHNSHLTILSPEKLRALVDADAGPDRAPAGPRQDSRPGQAASSRTALYTVGH